MSMDFVALVRYSRTPEVVRAINALENRICPISDEVQSLWIEQRFFAFSWRRTSWVSLQDSRQVKRPRGPRLDVALRSVDGFFLTFGQGVCCVYHLLRWRLFLTDPHWQGSMLSACGTIADILRSPDGVVMSDYHPAYSKFFDGGGFDACLKAAPPEEGEVESVSDLYQVVDPDGTWDSHGFWYFRRSTWARHGGTNQP